ncbi:MAG: sulfatase-like hydrolase/transferase, partial [Gammaproteobacteria bacterium]|nr:sulfatase-like hydrolase/transferase [Gammaproteobacteria bacterium]
FLPELYYLAGIPLTKHLGATTRKWISKLARSEKPFFINLFMGTTHPPFGSEWPYYNLFSNNDYRGESKFGMSRLTDPFEIIRSQKEPKESFDLDQITDIYDGSVRNFDDETRKIIHHLKKYDQLDNTIIVIYSDHGMEFFEHNTWGQGNNAIANASSHVPLVIHDPRNQQPILQNKTVRTTDIVPTILDLIGNDIPEYVDGVSLTDYMQAGNNDMHLYAYFETGVWLATPPGTDPDHIVYPEILELLEIPDIDAGTLSIKEKYYALIISARDRMIRNDKWKLVYLPMKGADRYLLFDLESDKSCKYDVAEGNPDIVIKLKAILMTTMEKD